MRFVAAAVRALSGAAAVSQRVSAQDARRVSRALRHIEEHSAEPLDLDRLASIAATSKFHFLRIFRRAVGLTPYQFLLSTRLRRAALRLLSTPDAVSAIAFESGFGDLSTFNSAFRDRFGANPLAFRRDAGRSTEAECLSSHGRRIQIAIAMQIPHSAAGQVAIPLVASVKNR